MKNITEFRILSPVLSVTRRKHFFFLPSSPTSSSSPEFISIPWRFSANLQQSSPHLLPYSLVFSNLSPLFPEENSNTQQIGIRAVVFGFNKIAPETRSQDVRRIEDSLEAANQRINGIEVKLHAQSDDLAQLKAMMKEIATQQIAIQQTLQTLSGEANSSQNRKMKIWALASEEGWLLPNGSDSLNCTQTLELKSSAEPGAEEAFFNQVVALSQMGLILLANAKKNAIYDVHLDYGHNPASTRLDYISEFIVTMPILNLTGTSDVMHGQSVAQVYCVQTHAIQQYTLELYQCLPPLLENVDALCCRFGGQKDPLEELAEHKQEGDLEGYNKDFDELWNRAQISEKQALVFFPGGREWLKRAMLPKPMFWFYEKKKKKLSLTEATWEEAEEFNWWFPSFHLEDKVDVMEGALSRTKEKKKMKGNERKAGTIRISNICKQNVCVLCSFF